ncbi:MAG: hypothetical protein ACE5JD_13425 [Candidatus Methylomirabilia bacterium]
MRVFTLIIAVVALVIAIIALVRTGGIEDVRKKMEALSSQTEVARERAAEAIDRLERLVRGEGRSKAE